MNRRLHLRLHRKRFASAALCAAALATQALPALADTASALPAVRFSAQVPAAPANLPLYSLTTAIAPRMLMDQAIRAHNASPMHLEALRTNARTTVMVSRDAQTNILRAYIDPKTNESVVIPNLAVNLARLENVHPQAIAAALFKRADVLPHDVTTFRLGNEIAVQGAAGTTGRVVSAPAVHFTFVSAMRYASGYPVYGAGSHAAIAVGTDGSVQGVLRRWKSAARSGSVATTMNAQRVQNAIRAQLAPFAAHNAITVDRVAVAYYDGNAQYMQPVYRFTAVLHPLSGRAADTRIAGFVPLGQTHELVPSLLSLRGTVQPVMPMATTNTRLLRQYSLRTQALLARQPGGTGSAPITLGEYANRDNTLNGMADQFYAGLTLHPPFLPNAGPPIVRTQYYYAQPWEVVGANSKNFMNAVNIAYTEPHGDWYYNTTYSNYADAWDVHNIGTNGNPGFGAAAGGKLATWIIDSCEVVPSMYDMSIATGRAADAFTPWWPVFQGLHNVIGFRTEMWLYDGMNTPFGFAAELGGDLNAAWFQEIAADPAYNDGYTYYDTHIKQNVHMGRASTFIDARDLGHSIYDVKPQTASTTLWNFWMSN